jgi:hypothetical protein
MLRLLFLAGAFLLMAEYAFAQAPNPMQCQQVREAVARYGYAAARRHALENYGAQAVRAGDQCLGRHYGTRFRTHHRGPYRTHHASHHRHSS